MNKMNYEEIGKKFVEICKKLDDIGVFYGNNYSGKYHEKYPHSSYWFALWLDKHRGSFEANIMNDGDVEKTLAFARENDNPALMIIELLEKSYEKLIEDDCLGDAEEN